MNNHFISISKILVLIFALTLSTTVASAVWNPPTAIPPGNNTLPPLHTGSEAQSTRGNLILDGLDELGAVKALGLGVINGAVVSTIVIT